MRRRHVLQPCASDANGRTRMVHARRQALSHNMSSMAQLQFRINELVGELSDVQVGPGQTMRTLC